MDEPRQSRGLSAADFFALRLDGATLTAAQIATGLAYTTICRARDAGSRCDPRTAALLSQWSRTLASAHAVGVHIDAARTLGLDVEPDGPVVVRDGFDQTEGV